jgi:MFS family permease
MNQQPSPAPGVSQNPVPTGPASKYRVVIAVLLFITLLVSYLDRTNIAILNASPIFQNDIGMTGQAAKMGLLMSVFLFAYGVGNIILAPLGNVLGPRKSMLIAIAIWFVSTLAGGFAGSFGIMLAIRVVLGFGEGLHWPMQSLYVANWFPLGERSKANSAWLVGLMVGPMLGNPLIAWIVGVSDWRMSFYVLAGISLIPLILIALLAPDTPRQSSHVNAAELAYIENGSPSPTGAATWSFLRQGDFWLVTIAFLASSSMFWGCIAWLPIYLKVARGFSWTAMGLLSSLPFLCATITVLVFGVVADRREKKAVFPTIALAGTALSILAASLVADNLGSALLLILAFAFLGSGVPSYWTIMQNNVARPSIGIAAGVLNGVSQIGSAFIPTIVGALVGTANASGHWASGLAFLVGMGLLGAACSLALMLRGK